MTLLTFFFSMIIILFHCLLQGPHIATVTLAAFECKSVDFPEPPYPNEYVALHLSIFPVLIYKIHKKKGTFEWKAYAVLVVEPRFRSRQNDCYHNNSEGKFIFLSDNPLRCNSGNR